MLRILNEWTHVGKQHLERFHNQDAGQTMVEYVMLIVLVALAVFLASPSITSAILGVFSNTSSALASGS